jgi:hypothetical protein
MGKPHKHAEIIKAWADGSVIEYYDGIDDKWYDVPNPEWSLSQSYRVKPERVFPVTSYSADELDAIYSTMYEDNTHAFALAHVANAAIYRYILDTEQAS